MKNNKSLLIAMNCVIFIACVFIVIGTVSSKHNTGPPIETDEPVCIASASDNVIEFIAEFEGYTPYAVWDYAQYSYGYGSKAEYEGEYISQEEALQLLKSQMKTYENSVVNFASKNSLTLNQNQFDALVSFSYNLGAGCWTKYAESDLVKLLISGHWTPEQIQDAFGQFCKAGGKVLPGLQRRRWAEANLFLYGQYETK